MKDVKKSASPKQKSASPKQKSASPKQKSASPKLTRSNSSQRTLYNSQSASPKQSPKPKKSILKKGGEKKPKKNILFNDFVQKAEAHPKEYYDRKGMPKTMVTKENIVELKKELNELMDSLYIHPESKKHTKRF